MLALGRAMMSRGSIMLLDEPSMGLAPVLVRDIFKALLEINRSGTTILLVEQNAHMALSIASRGYVLENGRITIAGPGKTLLDDPRIKEAYLGKRKSPECR
jgi:branched-chain amino acid transport system ATP-binding protein